MSYYSRISMVPVLAANNIYLVHATHRCLRPVHGCVTVNLLMRLGAKCRTFANSCLHHIIRVESVHTPLEWCEPQMYISPHYNIRKSTRNRYDQTELVIKTHYYTSFFSLRYFYHSVTHRWNMIWLCREISSWCVSWKQATVWSPGHPCAVIEWLQIIIFSVDM